MDYSKYNFSPKSIIILTAFYAACYWMIAYDAKTPQNRLVGGKGDRLSRKDVNAKEFAMGIKVEMEHTNDKSIAREIVLDHLSEDKKYYSKLIKAGL
jgi:hypothetical protein